MDVKGPRGASPQGGVKSRGQGKDLKRPRAGGGSRSASPRAERGDAPERRPCRRLKKIRHPFDPDGSRMLVSETKPCKSKYTSVNDGNCERLIKSVAI